MSEGDRSVYVLGLDGVPAWLVDRGVEQDRLPNLERIRAEGASGRTESTVPPLSMLAWSTFQTGQSPGNHGIYNFMQKEPGEYGTALVNADTLRSNAIPVWEYLDAAGIASGVMNVMPGHPVSRTRGVHISDNITTPPNGQFTHPKELQREIEDLVGEYYIDPFEGYTEGTDEEQLHDLVESLFEIERDRVEITKHLLETRDYRFWSLVFSGPDSILHVLGHLFDETHQKYDAEMAEKYGDYPLQLLELYDDLLGWVTDRMADDDVLFVLSDHGHGPVYQTVNLNSWLYQQGYLSLKSRPWTQLKLFGYNTLYGWVERALNRLNLYSRLKMGIARTSGGEGGLDLAELVTISQRDIDWNRTAAFTVSSGGQVYINTTEGYEEGQVPPERYDELRDELAEKLEALEHPERNERVIESVEYGEDVYPGSKAETRPDLVCVTAPGYQITFPQAMKTRQVFGEPPKTGSHYSISELYGVFYAYGGPVEEADGVTMQLADYAPTACDLLGVPVPSPMDGDARTDLYESDRPAARTSYDGRVQAKRAVRSVVDGLRSGD